jgi:hypothetical protein
MWLSILIQIVLSIAIIVIVHSLYEYTKNTFITKRSNGIIPSQVRKYKEIVEEMSDSKHANDNTCKMTILEKREMYDELCQLVEERNAPFIL